MKKLWTLLYAIGLCFVLVLSLFLFQMKEEYDDIYLNQSNNLSVITRDVKSDVSNEALITQLEQFAQQERINLYRIIENENETTAYNQDIFVKITNPEQFKQTFNLNQHAELSKLFTNTLPRDKFNDYVVTNFKPFSELKHEGIIGRYYFETTSNNFNKIKNYLSQEQFDYTVQQQMATKDIVEYLEIQPKFKPLISSLVLFFIIFIFISFYEVFIRFKEIAIQQLLGNYNYHIISYFLKEKLIKIAMFIILFNISILSYDMFVKHGARWLDLLLFSNLLQIIYASIILIIYSLSLLTIYMVNINLMIKGKKSIKILNIYSYIALFIVSIIMMLLLQFMLWMQNDLKAKLSQFEHYQSLKNYATTYISHNNVLSDKQLDENLKKLTVDQYKDMVLFETSYYYMGIHDSKVIDMGAQYPMLLINDNYLKNINYSLMDTTKIIYDAATLNVAMPTNMNDAKEQQWISYIRQKYSFDKVNVIHYDNKPVVLLCNNISKSTYY